MTVFAELRGRVAAALVRLGQEGALPPGLDLARSPARARAADTGCDAVVDAARVYADALATSGTEAGRFAARLAAEIARFECVETAEASGTGSVEVTLTADARARALAEALRSAAPEPDALPADVALPEARRIAAAGALARVDALASAGAGGGAPAAWGAVRVQAPYRGISHAGAAADVCGIDALRFALASGRPREPLRLDLTGLAERWRGNPAFAVPYAHARLRAALRRRDAGGSAPGGGGWPLDAGDLALLDGAGEGAPARAALRFPHALAASAAARSAHPLAAHLCRLAECVDAQWNRSKDQPQLPFVNEERRDLTSARLRSMAASALVLGSGLGILGVTAPDEMA